MSNPMMMPKRRPTPAPVVVVEPAPAPENLTVMLCARGFGKTAAIRAYAEALEDTTTPTVEEQSHELRAAVAQRVAALNDEHATARTELLPDYPTATLWQRIRTLFAGSFTVRDDLRSFRVDEPKTGRVVR